MERDFIRPTIITIGLILAGLFIGNGFAKGRVSDRFVTVKGTSEREVNADLAIWPIRLVSAGNELGAAHRQLEENRMKVMEFLGRQQLDTTALALQDFSVTDAYANQYGSPDRVANRYVLNQTLVVRSNEPQRVLEASQKVAELVSAGVVFSSGEQWGNAGPTFIFTQLTDLKPEMIAEATARAREAAEQFARDSKNSVGGIRRANQGVFEILGRDQAGGVGESGQIIKNVRVVSTIDYFLKD